MNPTPQTLAMSDSIIESHEPSTLPNKSSKVFQRFEKVIHTAVDHFPAALTIVPRRAGLRPTTYAARLRDALAWLRENIDVWPTPIDKSTFTRISDQLTVRQRGEYVYIGGLQETLEAVTPEVPDSAPTIVERVAPVQMISLTFTDQELLAKLAAGQLLTRPIEVVDMSEENAKTLSDNYDIALTKTEKGYIIQ